MQRAPILRGLDYIRPNDSTMEKLATILVFEVIENDDIEALDLLRRIAPAMCWDWIINDIRRELATPRLALMAPSTLNPQLSTLP